MTAALPSWVSRLSAVGRLPGPVFGKELLVASRRRKSYILRFAYVGLLAAFVAGAWLSSVPSGGRGLVAYQTSRMAAVSKHITVTIVWFQYIAAQLLALALLSKAVDAEIRKRTLHLLAVTPVGGMQIVGGKLAGGLLPILMLLAASLPLLAVARVWGGVPWSYAVSGVCITGAATVFTGTLSLFPYALYRPTGLAMIRTIWFMTLVRISDGFIEWLARFIPAVGRIGASVLLLVNPTDVLLARTKEMLAGRPSTGLSAWWPLHCLILLAGSVAVLLWMARRIRIIAADLPSACVPGSAAGRSTTWASIVGNRMNRFLRRRTRAPAAIRRVEGSPVLWKDLRNLAVFGSRRPWVIYGVPALIACLIAAGGITVAVFVFGSEASQVVGILTGYALGFHLVAIVTFSKTAAKGIAGEREARTLPVLLAAPLEDGAIVRDKAGAAFWQGLLLLAPLSVLFFLLLILLAGVTKEIGPLAVAGSAGLYCLSLLGIVPFCIGLGLYCSVRLKTTTGATGCMSLVFLGLVVLCLIGANLLRPIRMSRPQMWWTAFVLTVPAASACAGIGRGFLRAAARRLRDRVF